MLKGAALQAFGSAFVFLASRAGKGCRNQQHAVIRRPKLKITDVRTAQVMVHGPQTHVRIYTDQGIYGQGEATDAAVGAASLIRGWRRMLIGQDPLNVEAIWERIRTGGIFAGAQGGQYVTALSGLEIALWDLAGKALGLARLSASGRKVPRQGTNLLRLGYGRSHRRGIRPEAPVDQVSRVHGDEDRPRRCARSGTLRCRQLDREQWRNRSHGEVGFACARIHPRQHGSGLRYAWPLRRHPPERKSRRRWNRSG